MGLSSNVQRQPLFKLVSWTSHLFVCLKCRKIQISETHKLYIVKQKRVISHQCPHFLITLDQEDCQTNCHLSPVTLL